MATISPISTSTRSRMVPNTPVTPMTPAPGPGEIDHVSKTIIVCCDGTWQDADSGYKRPTIFPHNPVGTLQDPSNVVRISRGLRRFDATGRPQIVYYQAGVGSTGSILEHLSGGVLGVGVSENIREAYSFITTNYRPGDDIILIGFSRGAFTARSVAGLINDIGLLTRNGMSYFYPIFRDNENSENPYYRDIFPDQPFKNKPTGENKREEYKQMLVDNNLTRIRDPGSKEPIGIKAVAVWDTVGSLGVPHVTWWDALHLPHASKELQFHDTSITSIVRHAFQALALDEYRGPFSPAVWERDAECTTDLRQVWFPGSHGNVGGGCEDQELANVSLAWMMDQLASIGVAFAEDTIKFVFETTEAYYRKNKPSKSWAHAAIYKLYDPVRPWSLGSIYKSYISFWLLAGRVNRSPGLYQCADPKTGMPKPGIDDPLKRTNERVHSSVRTRIELGGLDPGDSGLYTYAALKGNWEKRQMKIVVDDPISLDASWAGPSVPQAKDLNNNPRWVWEYIGPKTKTPSEQIMVEDALGPYERKLIQLSGLGDHVLGDSHRDLSNGDV